MSNPLPLVLIIAFSLLSCSPKAGFLEDAREEKPEAQAKGLIQEAVLCLPERMLA
jgi:hypothetical protein